MKELLCRGNSSDGQAYREAGGEEEEKLVKVGGGKGCLGKKMQGIRRQEDIIDTENIGKA